ncbi:hypothetical protein DICPUDRAFT_75282 [Dictyostelium purpureum]|uniref:ASPIC/UnbV domain-containing protein n=1 Tax=Dictyostelium purpureum TaxID=5786 RepID=F0ZA79_DICPU|nr:uncharacterized protein DICPUDRAFT_75282 [Dictyostelium purpureum]EGC39156.1 hypothetical protein DICPUDRAFT_75282 [Dictyostelium purpureum]|eukprot:XP_003284302.1 hypothetical protein DICPUDRAFT_75282 [Dictyostelium purpureum]
MMMRPSRDKYWFLSKNKPIIFILIISSIIFFKLQYDVMQLSEELQKEKNIIKLKNAEIQDFNQYIHLLEKRFISLGGDETQWGCSNSHKYNMGHYNIEDEDDDPSIINDPAKYKLLSLETMMKIQDAKYAPNFEQPSKCIKEEMKAYPMKLMCSKYQYNYKDKMNFIGVHQNYNIEESQTSENNIDNNLLLLKEKSNGISNFKISKKTEPLFTEVLLNDQNVYVAPSFGSSWGDFNNDGFMDLYISNHYWYPTLLLNQNGTSFKDVSKQYIKGYGQGKFIDKHSSAWADFNKDGNLDLLEVTGALYGTSSIPNNLFVNDGKGGFFSEESAKRGIDYPFARGRTITWLDYDNDGRLDAFISSQKRSDQKGKSAMFRSQVDQDGLDVFLDVTKMIDIDNDIKILFARQTDLDNDGQLELLLISFTFPFKIYHTSSDDPYKPFKDVTPFYFPVDENIVRAHKAATVNSSVDWVPPPPETGFFAVVTDIAFGDMDRNGWQDIVLARQYMGKCIVTIYYNYGIYNSTAEKKSQSGERKSSNLKWEYKDVYANDVSQCGSLVVGDFDNDLNLDIYLVTYMPFANSPNVYISNRGGGYFAAKNDAMGAAGTSFGKGESVTVVDYNNDGHLDLLVTNGKGAPPYDIGPVQLFKNVANSNKNWIQIDLQGIDENAHGFGGRIYITSCKKIQFRDVESGVHFSAQNSFRVHFGLGQCPTISEIKVFWPRSKQYQILKNIQPNQILKIVEDVFLIFVDGE